MPDLVALLAAMTSAQRAAYLDSLTDPADLDVVEAAIAEAEQAVAAQRDEAAARHEHESTMARQARWFADPVAFAEQALRWPDGQRLKPHQAEALRRLARRRRLAVRSLHGVGKTTISALAVLWFVTTREYAASKGGTGRDWKVITTASVWRQLTKYLWPEVHKWAKRLRWDVVGLDPWRKGRELLDLSIKLENGEAFAAASDDAAKLEGAHAPEILFVFDEAKTIPSGTFDAAEGALAGGGDSVAYALAGSTPGAPSGRFAEIHHRKPGTEDWDTLHVTLADAIASGMVALSWAQSMERLWGKGSALYLNRVEGEFATDETDSVIPLAWVELANERWLALVAANGHAPSTEVGIDVARFGGDRSVVVAVAGDLVGRPVFLPHGNSTDTANAALPHTGRKVAGPFVMVDASGVGAGVYDRLADERELPARMAPFDASAATRWRDASGLLDFGNTRAAAWWNLRELLDPTQGATLALPPDDDTLTGDLCTPRWRHGAGGRIFVESKDDIRARLGRSTDAGDALVMAMWGRYVRASHALRPAKATNGHRGVSITGDLLEAAL